MKAVYLETSALLRLLNEEGAKDVERKLRSSDHVVASRLLKVEAERALLRLALDRPGSEALIADLERELRDLWPRVSFLEVTAEVCDHAGRVAPTSRLRTLDAIHFASFLRARQLSPGVEMLSFDERISSLV